MSITTTVVVLRVLLTLIFASLALGPIVAVLEDIKDEREHGFHMDWQWRIQGLLISLGGAVMISVIWLVDLKV